MRIESTRDLRMENVIESRIWRIATPPPPVGVTIRSMGVTPPWAGLSSLSGSPPPMGGALLPPLGLSLMLVAAVDWTTWSEYTFVSSSSLNSRVCLLLLLLNSLLMKDSWSWPWARAVSCVVIVRHQTAESGSLLPGNGGRRICAPNSIQKSAELRGAVKSASHCGRHHRSTQSGPGGVKRALSALLSCAEADQTQLTTRQWAARALKIIYRPVFTHERPDSWSIA